MNLRAVREYLRGSLWFAPAVGVLLVTGLAFLLLAADRALDERDILFVFSAGPDSARTFLSTIAASMITFVGLVFSITIVVLQLASQQFSPRVLRTFLRDRQSKLALATFVGTFVFALLILREVRSGDAGAGVFVPRLSVTATLLLVMLSLAAFVAYVHHIAQAVRAATIVDVVGDETRRQIERHYPADAEPVAPSFAPSAPAAAEIISTHAPGVITDFDAEGLVASARDADVVLELVPAVGDFVPQGAALFRVHGSSGVVDEDRVRDDVSLSRERTMQQDVAFGFRQLTDIAIRALSSALNDPTTAVQVLDQVHDLLRRLGTRPLPPGERRDRDDAVRLVYPVTSWEGFVEVALEEIRQNGARHVQVVRRIRAIVDDLMAVVPEDRRRPLRRELEALDAAVDDAYPREHERALAAEADSKGLGS